MTPAARMVYDPIRQRIMFVAGGYSNAVWVLDVNNPVEWTQLTVGGAAPVPRAYPVVAFDEAADRVVMTGGWNGSAGVSDTWALDMTPAPTWHLLAPTRRRPALPFVGALPSVEGGRPGALRRLDDDRVCKPVSVQVALEERVRTAPDLAELQAVRKAQRWTRGVSTTCRRGEHGDQERAETPEARGAAQWASR